MKIINKILPLFFILILSNIGFGQEVPWRYQKTGAIHTLIVDTKTTIEASNYSNNGFLGVFYDSLGVDVCVGYMDLAQTDDYLIAYGETKNNSGIKIGEKFKFKLWDKEQDCIYDDVSVTYLTTEQAPNTGVYTTDGVSKIAAIKASAIEVAYTSNLICPNNINFPSIIDSGRYSFSFSAENGLSINENSGLIDAASSKPGEYIINVSSNYCISNPSHRVRVSYSDINIPEQFYKCPDELFDVNSIAIEVKDFWEISDSLSSTSLLETGEHTLNFKNNDGCVVEQQINIVDYPKQELQLEKIYNCESTTIYLSEDQNETTVDWPTDATGNSMEVYKNSNIELQYTDSNNCSRVKSIDVEIKKLEIQSLETKVYPADCYLKGRIEINNLNIENKVGELHYEFINQLTNETFQLPDQLTEGKYQVAVFDDRNCSDTWSHEIAVLKDCLKDRPVFSPNNDYVDDTYYISDSGFAEVYNRNGNKVCEFETPIYWDGTNQEGQKLPMGTYLIVINNKKVTNITILR